MESAAPADLNAETRTERHLRLLAELAELGMRLTRTLVAQAEETPGAEADPQLAYARLTRSIRQTMALETKLAEEGRLFRERKAREHRHQRQAQVRRLVERAIDADADDSDVDDLLCDLNERLSDPDDTDVLRPLIEVVAGICKDLGVPFDPTEWREMDGAVDGPPSLCHPGQGPRSGPQSRDPGGSAVRWPLGPGSPLRGVRDDIGEELLAEAPISLPPPRHPGFRAAKDRDP